MKKNKKENRKPPETRQLRRRWRVSFCTAEQTSAYETGTAAFNNAWLQMRELVLQRSRSAASVFRERATALKRFFFFFCPFMSHQDRRPRGDTDAATATVFEAGTAALVLEFWHIHLENIPLLSLNHQNSGRFSPLFTDGCGH